jgi:magnesium-transporting ATPase (P-type)
LEWNERYLKACSKITDREEAVEEIQDEIERDLELLGGTAIEDKL